MIQSCSVCGGLIADHMETYSGTPCVCAARLETKKPDTAPEDVANLADYAEHANRPSQAAGETTK